jgi:hypothetical protein
MEIYLALGHGGYEVRKFIPQHEGHEQSHEAYKMHPQGRKLDKSEEEQVLKCMTELKAPKRNMRQYVLNEFEKNVTSKDLINLERRAASKFATSDMAATRKILNARHQADANSSVHFVAEEEEDIMGSNAKVLKIIFWQSGKMRRDFEKFGSILFIDGTYNLTNRKYVLYPFHVIDEHKNSRLVGWALVSCEKQYILEEMLSLFKDANPTANELLRYVIIDKNFTEMAALNKIFPAAKIIICQFHAMKAVGEHIRRIPLSSEKQYLKKMLETLFGKMLHSPTEHLYMDAWAKVIQSAEDNEELREIQTYLEVNWHDSREHWASHALLHENLIESFTNNRSEGFNKHLKRILKKQRRVPDVILAMFSIEEEQGAKSNQETFENTNKTYQPVGSFNDPCLQELLELGQKLISKKKVMRDLELQYELSKYIEVSTLSIKENQTVCPLIKGECAFFKQHSLPCKHLFALRKHNKEKMIEPAMIPGRWSMETASDQAHNSNKLEHGKSVTIKKFAKGSTTLVSQYNTAKVLTDEIAEMISSCSAQEFKIKLEQLQIIKEAWRSNCSVHIEENMVFMMGNDKLSSTDNDVLVFPPSSQTGFKISGL